MFKNKTTLLLDMNSTFMFGEDSFDDKQDYSIYYKEINGQLPDIVINKIIDDILIYLGDRYPDEKYRHCFPSIADAIRSVVDFKISNDEIDKVVSTFSYHEHGYIPDEYVEILFKLQSQFTLAVVIDIWSPKERWLNTFKELGIADLFSASSFSSDHGMVKPSPKPFELVVNKLGITKDQCLVVGDSIRRDLGGANLAGIDCILVGGGKDKSALGSYSSLLEFYDTVMT